MDPHRSRALAPFIGAAAVFLIGVAAVIGSLRLGYWTRGPGPGFFPLWIGALLAVLAVLWATGIRRDAAGTTEESAGFLNRDALLVLAALTVATLLLEVLGYQLTMFGLVLYVLLHVGRQRLLISVIFAALAGFGVYGLFANVLQVQLPTSGIGLLTGLGL